MKQGTKFMMGVDLGIKLDDVSVVDFKFTQGIVKQHWIYPSASAVRVGTTNTINLIWTIEDTFKFETGKPIYMDSFVTLEDSEYNPDTEIQVVVLEKTLFTEEELSDE